MKGGENVKRSKMTKTVKNRIIRDINMNSGSFIDSQNPAVIRDNLMKISYLSRLADTHQYKKLNEAIQELGFPTIDNSNPAIIKDNIRMICSYLLPKVLEGNPLSFDIKGNLTPEVIRALIAMLPIQSGTGDPSPTNIRPISGRDSVRLVRTGINQWDEEWEVGTFLNANGTKYPSTTKIRNKNPISVKPNTTYYYYVGSTSADEDRIWCYDADMNFIKSFFYVHQTTIGVKLTTPVNCSYINFSIKNTTYNNDISINYPATDTDYHAYDGQTYTATFPSTVYGGSYDFVSGEGKSTFGFVDLGNLTWQMETHTSGAIRFQANVSGLKGSGDNQTPCNMMCSIYKNDSWANVVGVVNDKSICGLGTIGGVIAVQDNDYNSAEAFKTAMSGVQLCYELATPTETTLTPQSIALNKGDNVITTDGDNLQLEYQLNA